MNDSFKSVFSEEEAFPELNMTEAHEGFKDGVVQKEDVSRLLVSLDVRKAMGPDGVSGWTTHTANLGSDYQLNRGGEGATRVEEGKHISHLQRKKEN